MRVCGLREYYARHQSTPAWSERVLYASTSYGVVAAVRLNCVSFCCELTLPSLRSECRFPSRAAQQSVAHERPPLTPSHLPHGVHALFFVLGPHPSCVRAVLQNASSLRGASRAALAARLAALDAAFSIDMRGLTEKYDRARAMLSMALDAAPA